MISSPSPTRSGLIVLIVSLLILSACGRKPEGPPPMGGPMPVTVAVPLRHEIVDWDRYLGRLEPVESVEIRARVSGYLDAVHFTEGAAVTAGSELFSIDPRPLRAERSRARAELERSRAGLEVARAQKVQAEAGLVEVTARKKQFDALLALAEKRSQRAERAVAGNAIAAETVDVRKSEVQQASANVAAAEAEIASARAAIVTATASVSAAAADIDAAQAALEIAELDLSYCVVKAPISGRISREFVTAGNFVTGGGQGATLLTTIVATDAVYCYFDASERALLRYLRLGREAGDAVETQLRNPAFLALVDEVGFPHRGYVDFVDNRVDRETGTIRARAILRNETGVLLPGLFATVCVPGSLPHEAILIPDSAVVSDQSDRFVWIVEADGSVARRSVELGPTLMGHRVIESGLDGSERVVIRGLQRIRPGGAVMPQEEKLEIGPRTDGLPNRYEQVSVNDMVERQRSSREGKSR